MHDDKVFIKPETDADAMVTASLDRARRDRARQNILGLVAAFGRHAFTRSTPRTPRTPRHADTWRDKGPHESNGAARRRLRQMARAGKQAF